MSKITLLVIFAVFLVIAVIAWTIHLIKRKKKAALLAIFGSAVFAVAFFVIFPTRFPFVDSWIIGKSIDEIVTVYGDNYKEGYNNKSIYYENINYYYIIILDENDIAVRVTKSEITPMRRGCIV